MNKSLKISMCGLISALGIVCMLLTGILTIGTYILPVIAGALFVPVVIEIGKKEAWMCYAVVSILSILIAPDKEAVVFLIALFGYYPIIKATIENKLSVLWEWIIKMVLFNAAMILGFYITVTLLQIPKESYELFGVYLPGVFLVLGNICCVIYDFALTRIVQLYIKMLHPMMNKLNKKR